MSDATGHGVAGPAGQLHVTEWSEGDPDAATLFVHGATYPGRAIFGPVPDGHPAWGPWTAARGDAALALDIRGYGGSHPVAAPDDEPPVRTPAAAADLDVAVDWAHERFDRLHLVGTSWGTQVCGRYLPRRTGRVGHAPRARLRPLPRGPRTIGCRRPVPDRHP